MNGREERLSSLLSTGATPLAPASSFARSIPRGSSTSFDSPLSDHDSDAIRPLSSLLFLPLLLFLLLVLFLLLLLRRSISLSR